MSSVDPPRLLISTSTIIIAVLAPQGQAEAARNILKMSENRLAIVTVGNEALRHAELAARKRLNDEQKIKDFVATVGEHIVRCRVGIAPTPNQTTIEACADFTENISAARIIATAIEQGSEVIVSADQVNLLKNPKIGPPNTDFVVMNEHEAFGWALDQAKVRSRLRASGG